ncbi:hypothetical protein R3P38DRAFT_1346746 [Favolaschia claudopus]|uniref:Uncharacterized protein n=1 Tax=Favolaschia claudopus TaxID=2862362 RepID=A0AAW0DQ93_9AGAR
MNRDYAPTSRGPQLSRNASNNVGWGTKIKGAIQVTHGLGEAIRGTLGASDFGPQNYTPSGQIAHRGRQEIAEGLARMRGTAAQLPSAPIYDRRHSYPTHQYEQRGPMASVLRRRSASTHMRRENPPTASEPFEKFYEHPHVQRTLSRPDDSGFAGVGAGVDPATRKEGGGIVPAFLIQSPAQLPSSSIDVRYPSQPSHGNFHPNNQTQYQQPSSLAGVPPMTSPTTLRSCIISAPTALGAPSERPNNTDFLSVPSQQPPGHSSSSGSVASQPSRSPLRSNFLGGEVARKGKEKEKEPHNKLRRRRRRSFFGRRVVTRPSTPDRDEALRARQEFTRSAPATPPRPAHQHESTLEHAGYDVLSYDAKDVYPSWPTEGEIRRQQTTRFEPVRGR